MKHLYRVLVGIMAFATILTSCNKDEDVAVTSVNVTPATSNLIVGGTLELKAEITPTNATDQTLTWTSADKAIATVSETGLVTAIAPGEVVITAKSKNAKSASSRITVQAAVVATESINLSETSLSILKGGTATLTATVVPDNATDQTVTWSSNDTKIATVNNGVITGVSEGKTTIVASCSGKTANCEVTITNPADIKMTFPRLSAVTSGTMSFTSDGIVAGDKIKLESVAGAAYSKELDVTVSGTNGTVTLPSDFDKTRSYRVTLVRGGSALTQAWIHPDENFVALPYALGYYLTGSNEVVPNDDANKPSDVSVESSKRKAYIDSKIVDYDETAHTFRVWKGDAKLSTFKLSTKAGESAVAEDGTVFDIQETTSLTDISPLKGLFDLSKVIEVYVCNSYITSVDMTMFPNAQKLRAWGNPGSNQNKIASVDFGTACNLDQVQLERQSLKTIDLRSLTNANCSVSLDDNQLESIEMGSFATAGGKACPIYALSAKNNKLKEINIDNCNRIRILQLEGNKIERATLLMQYAEGSSDGVVGFLYLLKAKEAFNVTWATAAEAEGRERKIKVEYYWWRCFSKSNGDEAAKFETPYTEEEWETNGPVVKALKDGFTVECWHSSSWYAPFSLYETHAGGTDPCPRQ